MSSLSSLLVRIKLSNYSTLLFLNQASNVSQTEYQFTEINLLLFLILSSEGFARIRFERLSMCLFAAYTFQNTIKNEFLPIQSQHQLS